MRAAIRDLPFKGQVFVLGERQIIRIVEGKRKS